MHQTNNPGFLTKSLSDFLMSLFWGSSFAPSTYIVPTTQRIGNINIEKAKASKHTVWIQFTNRFYSKRKCSANTLTSNGNTKVSKSTWKINIDVWYVHVQKKFGLNLPKQTLMVVSDRGEIYRHQKSGELWNHHKPHIYAKGKISCTSENKPNNSPVIDCWRVHSPG